MDKEQIRENLAGYRPELYRDDDPLIAESLTASPQADFELGETLVRHQRETKGWRDDHQIYLLVGSKPGVAVGNLLSTAM